MKVVYLDACVLNRPTDDLTIPRNRLEAEAINAIFLRIRSGELQWVSSELLEAEIAAIRSEHRRRIVAWRLRLADRRIELNDAIRELASTLCEQGLSPADALHCAFAEVAKVDALLTTDDRLIKRAGKLRNLIRIAVLNPTDFGGTHED